VEQNTKVEILMLESYLEAGFSFTLSTIATNSDSVVQDIGFIARAIQSTSSHIYD